jgi:hypothetical protein
MRPILRFLEPAGSLSRSSRSARGCAGEAAPTSRVGGRRRPGGGSQPNLKTHCDVRTYLPTADAAAMGTSTVTSGASRRRSLPLGCPFCPPGLCQMVPANGSPSAASSVTQDGAPTRQCALIAPAATQSGRLSPDGRAQRDPTTPSNRPAEVRSTKIFTRIPATAPAHPTACYILAHTAPPTTWAVTTEQRWPRNEPAVRDKRGRR